MRIGFIGLGNLGEKLAATLLRNSVDLIVHDKFNEKASKLINNGAKWEDSPFKLAQKSDFIITCLPSPSICAEVMESKNGVLQGISPENVWIEMSTTSKKEVLVPLSFVRQRQEIKNNLLIRKTIESCMEGKVYGA